jgi:hypothetical protein
MYVASRVLAGSVVIFYRGEMKLSCLKLAALERRNEEVCCRKVRNEDWQMSEWFWKAMLLIGQW